MSQEIASFKSGKMTIQQMMSWLTRLDVEFDQASKKPKKVSDRLKQALRDSRSASLFLRVSSAMFDEDEEMLLWCFVVSA